MRVACLARPAAAEEASAPRLYAQPAYESPVSGDPDGLLLLAGQGLQADDQVIYEAVRDPSQRTPIPAQLPTVSTRDLGLAEIVARDAVPYALTVRLPDVLRTDRAYVLWVRSPTGAWSNPVSINDARPLWVTPAYVFSTAAIPGLPREIKIVGRNLEPVPGVATRVRLQGPETYVAAAIEDERTSRRIDRYVARLRLPAKLRPGLYRIALSRDGQSWTEVPEQRLLVREDPATPHEFSVGDPRYGACQPDDGLDDTACILKAIAAAGQDGGGVVQFGTGTWDLIDGNTPGLASIDGIAVPVGISLRGAGAAHTRIDRHANWNQRAVTVAFSLLGRNRVEGLRFHDLQVYGPRDRVGPFLQVGENSQLAAAHPATPNRTAADIVISANVFDKTNIAIADGGLPIDRLIITGNLFGAYVSALELGGNRFNVDLPYRIDDSVIAGNRFAPSSKLDLAGRSGPVATELGAGDRVDFSDNVADGASTDFLYSPTDPPGWRAGFFWNLEGNVEETLVSQNTATCTGDKIGDGEAIAYDNNANTFAFTEPATVTSASSDSVSVTAALVARQNDRDVATGTYYLGHWIQVVSGVGLGQARKIVAYSTNPRGVTTFHITPAWDVAPAAGSSRIAVGREFWQVYTLDNHIDHRRPLCRKSNRSKPAGGEIVMWAASADSVIAGNSQHDADGILVQQAYIAPERPCKDCTMASFFNAFLEIRDNDIDGEYDWASNCSSSGIIAGIAASSAGDPQPPTVGFGVHIAYNRIQHAAAPQGAAIDIVATGEAGPPPHVWALSENLLVDHNAIADVTGAEARPGCGPRRPRTGIGFPQPAIAWDTVLYANRCTQVALPLATGGGIRTQRVCPAGAQPSCECP
jgi:hypothetical protein